jgi:glutathione gamma-glutamylcysteinyltransferase
VDKTLYRRPLPAGTIAFSSPEGQQVFKEALALGGLDGYFQLAEQFHTQSDPSFCGLGSLVVALNALAIDPGRLWKGPWRWFSEDLLDCCVSLPEVRARGLDVDELTCLARCNGADVELKRADSSDIATWRSAIGMAATGEAVIIASYDRAAMNQTGSGHFSPIGGHHPARDLVLVLDVARFKYPPHWVSAEQLWHAMKSEDPATGRARGWITLRRRNQGIALGFSLQCDGDSWQGLANRTTAAVTDLRRAEDLDSLIRAVAPLAAHLELRAPGEDAHQDALTSARAALHGVTVYPLVVDVVGKDHAEKVTILLLAVSDLLSPMQRKFTSELTIDPNDVAFAWEVNNVRAQLAAMWGHSRQETLT